MLVVRLRRDVLHPGPAENRLRAELLRQPALPNARVARDHHALRLAPARELEPLVQREHLRISSDERQRQPCLIPLADPLADPAPHQIRRYLQMRTIAA